MTELDGLIERLRAAYAAADRTSPGPFEFVSSVTTGNGDCIVAVVIALDSTDARRAAAKVLTG
jgi:hypothetical protein